MLVADAPVKDVAALESRLARADIPELDPHVLLLGDPRDPQPHFDKTRGLDPELVTAPKGPRRLFDDGWLSEFKFAEIIAFLFVEAEGEEPGD